MFSPEQFNFIKNEVMNKLGSGNNKSNSGKNGNKNNGGLKITPSQNAGNCRINLRRI